MRYVDDRVETAEIIDNAITTTKILNGTVSEAKLTPPANNKLNASRIARFVYDWNVDGGVAGSIPFRGDALPAKDIIKGGRAYVVRKLTGPAGTTAGITAVAGDDIIADAVVAGAPWNLDATEIAIIPVDSLATDVVWTAGGIPALVVTTHNLTDGAVDLWLEYIVND